MPKTHTGKHWFHIGTTADAKDRSGGNARWAADRRLTAKTDKATVANLIRAARAHIAKHRATVLTAGLINGRGHVRMTLREPTQTRPARLATTGWPLANPTQARYPEETHGKQSWSRQTRDGAIRGAIEALLDRCAWHQRALDHRIAAARTPAARQLQCQMLHADTPMALGWETEITENMLLEPDRQLWFPRPSTSPALAMAMADMLYRQGTAGCTIRHTADDPAQRRYESQDEYLTVTRTDHKWSVHSHEHRSPDHDLTIETKYMPASVLPNRRDANIRGGWRALATGWSRDWGAGRVPGPRNAAEDRRTRELRHGAQPPRPVAATLHPVVRTLHRLLTRLEAHVECEIAWEMVAGDES